MATKIISMTYQLKRGKESTIEAKNPILASGEPIVVFCDNNVTKLKIGDGKTPYKQLPFVCGSVSYDDSGEITQVIVDSELSLTSTNPVQNKIITAAINDLKDTKVTAVPGKQLSTNDFSDEEKIKLASLQKVTVDTEIDVNSFNPISNNAVAGMFNNFNTKLDNLTIDGGEII